MKNILQNKYVLIGITLIVGAVIGWLLKPSPNLQSESGADQRISTPVNEIWTCSMHPQIRQGEPGDCPICGMDLIPVDTDQGEDLDPMSISMSPTAMLLADIRTATVGTMDPVKMVRLNGKVQEDERLIFSQSSHIPGRIEKLMVNFTGEYVRKGQAIAYLYSPDLVTAQDELFEAQKIKDTQPQLFNAAKEKLKNWKLTDKQVDEILEAGTPKEQFAIQADVSGYVTEKSVKLGDYIQKGTSLYEIADLSQVWVLFDVYESDMAWVKKGNQVNFTVASLPGETFEGSISFIDPVIDPKTRVAKARVMVTNKDLRLKPEMFTSGTVEATLPAKSSNVAIPKTAVMWTGKRSVVYVKNTSGSGVSFMMRTVTLGQGLGSSFIIEDGLEAGEEIAVNGTFSIDAAAQLAGKPSMMNPDGGPAMTGHNHGGGETPAATSPVKRQAVKAVDISQKAKETLQPLYVQYLSFKDALVADDLATAQKAAAALKTSLEKVNMAVFTGASHNAWMRYSSTLKDALQHTEHLKDIGAVRKAFQQLSEGMIDLTKAFQPLEKTLYIQHCPMADSNKGADWLSTETEILNPYFGASMLSCGEVKEQLKK
jgi:Cu(I)/Ag(I) efflux system membrane fusion protein